MGTAPFDYEHRAASYPSQRRADARIAARIEAALGDARTVVNVGAGPGSYEPVDRHVTAVEPSAAMRAQRPPHLPPAVNGRAEALPLDDRSVDAAMACVTVHHWADPISGIREMRRVARGPVVILTIDIDAVERYWMVTDYLPEVIADDRARFPQITEILGALGNATAQSIPIPLDCSDGFFEAHYGRPEAYLDPAVRAAQSIWPRLPAGVEARAVSSLAGDLASGAWDERHGELRSAGEYEGGLRLIVGRPASSG